MQELLIPILAVTAIGLVCGVGLCIASAFMRVQEDERLEKIRACLPGANCGGCGFSGCDGYARALLEPGTKTNLCVPGGDAAAQAISAMLGVEAEDVVEQVAVVQCSGTCEHTQYKQDYRGLPSCKAAKVYFGGTGTCIHGCLGLGDCAKVCPQGAIGYNKGVAQVDLHKCIGCGLCSRTCPQGIIQIVPDVIRTAVLCSSKDKGARTKAACSAGCIGCKKCERTCEADAIHVTDNVARIDYTRCTGCGKCAEVCTSGVIRYGDFSGIHHIHAE